MNTPRAKAIEALHAIASITERNLDKFSKTTAGYLRRHLDDLHRAEGLIARDSLKFETREESKS
jgi:hypothetical protein